MEVSQQPAASGQQPIRADVARLWALQELFQALKQARSSATFYSPQPRPIANRACRRIIDEVDAKVRAIKRPHSVSIRTALIYEGFLAPIVKADGYFDAIVPIQKLLGLSEG